MRWGSDHMLPPPVHESSYRRRPTPHAPLGRGHRGLLLQESSLWEIISHSIG